MIDDAIQFDSFSSCCHRICGLRSAVCGLPMLITNCANNYGPYHLSEKLTPLMIVNALAGKPLPMCGDAQ